MSWNIRILRYTRWILYKISFLIIQIKKISESKKNKSINEKHLLCNRNKKKQLSSSKLRIISKIKLSVSLINKDSLTFSLFLVDVNVDSKVT